MKHPKCWVTCRMLGHLQNAGELEGLVKHTRHALTRGVWEDLGACPHRKILCVDLCVRLLWWYLLLLLLI